MMEYNTGFILSRQYIAVSESLFGGYVCPWSEFQIWPFRIFLKSRPCPCWYLTDIYVVCHHSLQSFVSVSRPCCLSEFYPNGPASLVLVFSDTHIFN